MKVDKWFVKDSPEPYAKPLVKKPNPFYTDQIYNIVLGPKEIDMPSGRLDERYWIIFQRGNKVLIAGSNNGSWDTEHELFQEDEFIKEIGCSFDQLGRPIVIYRIKDRNIKLYWYNPLIGQSEIRDLTTGTNPFAAFDVIDNTGASYSDVMLFYKRNKKVYYRLQRDRYNNEYETPLEVEDNMEFVGGGLTAGNRFQIVYRVEDKT